ncbi:Leucine-rich repeat transmembrane protein kinase [Euphorbia peplus]|nr:Leucine-rich repeat transmembrane protein kinase [Euphorbia peplus]
MIIRKVVIGMVVLVVFYDSATGLKANSRCPTYNPHCDSYVSDFNCSIPGGLPCDEANAMKALIEGLNVEIPREFSRQNCNVSVSGIYIQCSCTTTGSTIVCHIIDIIITGVGVSKSILHENVSNLSYLQSLDLSDNNINGRIPEVLGNMKNLEYIYLRGNVLGGSIPSSFGNLTSLKALSLRGNYFRGRVPSSLGNLTSLEHLNLGYNFLNGDIPSSLGSLAWLQNMDLFGNMLTGEVPKEFGKLTNLLRMDIGENQLIGHLPLELGYLINLQELALGSNKFSGKLPESYKNFSSMEYFDVSANYLDGQVPSFFSEWENLTSLFLLGNEFEGNLPVEIFQMSNLDTLWVSDLRNTTDFSFPKEGNLSNIFRLILRNCSINGHIPNYIGKWSQLEYLDLSFNNLNGSIPDSLEHVSELYLTRNMLGGHLPSWTNDKTHLDISYNNFQIQPPKDSEHGTSNTTIANLNYALDKKRQHCDSQYNSLYINCGGRKEVDPLDGQVYDEDVSQEMFYESGGNRWAYTCSGDFSSGDYREISLNASDFIKNKTCGVSDDTIVDTARLCPVALTYYAFCLLNGNYSVKLKFAETVFSKDEDHSSLGKRVFDLYIQGVKKLPNFNMKDETPEDPYRAVLKEYVANVQDHQLVIHFFWAGKGTIDISPYLSGPLVSSISVKRNSERNKVLSTSQIAGITVGSVLMPMLVVAFLWKMGLFANRELQEVQIDVKGRHFTLKQIIDATRNFSPKAEIGRGRFGIVYKVELPGQIQLAVKKISPDSMQDKLKTELQGEIFNLKSLKHENLIELLNGYSKKDLHLLIYEYMENGSLYQVVLDPNSKIVLDWKVRFDICLGLAKALKYLHEETGVKILHRNVKANNVLLDGCYTPKLTDFGWARLYNENDPFLTIKAEGARVYMAPEYALGQAITDKADVYSYGVVVLEVFSGRPGISNLPNRQEAAYLLDDARIAHAHGRLDKLVDRKMENYDRKVAFAVLNLAIMCIHPTADLRPTMSQVVSVLLNEKTIDQIFQLHVS